ncbi:calcium-binding protein [Amaricoccus sp.]|uniref:beta strand repeat-containing protein n=1 Tax=Amaricoccus sp. TaxID=1872485 RepID=UPI001B4EF7A9|nr:calcium-binding protein [Amaricoccus sp.]MBP7000481.1 hypothetical protein [Amaricoccus sp.]
MATINGTNGNDQIPGPIFNVDVSGDDIIDAKGGHDTVNAGDGADEVRGGTGNDTLNGEGGDDVFVGDAGDGFDQFFGGDGFDEIRWNGIVGFAASFGPANGVEKITASGILGNGSNNILDFTGVTLDLGPAGEINGGAGHNTIIGSSAADIIRGGGGNDTLRGEGGGDLFVGDAGDGFDQFFGGDGFDEIRWNGIVGFAASFGPANGVEKITASGILGNGSNNILDFTGVTLDLGPAGEINGGAGHNTVIGTSAADIVRGGGGNDTLHGAGGDDRFVGQSGDGFDQFHGGEGTDRIEWAGELGLMNSFGPANSIEVIKADAIRGYASTVLDFSRTAFEDVTLVRGDNDVAGQGVGHNTIVTSLSRIDGLVYDGGGGNDKVTVTLAPDDFSGSGFGPTRGLIKDISESRTADFDSGFTFDDSLGLRVEDFEQGLSYGWFTLAGALATAPLANVKLAIGTISGTAGNDVLISTTNNLDTYLAGAGDDLIVHATGGVDRFVTGAGDDTIVVVGDRGGRINDTADTATPDTGLDQMFVVDGTRFSLGGHLRGIEHIEFLDAAGAGEIATNGTGIQPDFTHTTLVGVNLVKGANNSDIFITAREHHDVGGGVITYDGGNSVPYDRITVSLGDFTQLGAGNGLRTDLEQLLSAPNNVSINGFTFDTAFDGFGLRIQNIGDNRSPVKLDANAVKLGYIGHDGELVQVAPTAANVIFATVSGNDTKDGTAGNDIWLRGANQSTFNGGDGDDLIVGFSGFGSVGLARLDGQNGSDTYLLAQQGARIEDTGGAGDHDRILAVRDGHLAVSGLLKGIEEINANGFAGVELRGSASGDEFFLQDTLLIGIDTVRTVGSVNRDTVHTNSAGKGHVTYDGGGNAGDVLNFYLTEAQADDADVLTEIQAFKAVGANDNNDWTFNELDFSIIDFATVRFWDGDTLV